MAYYNIYYFIKKLIRKFLYFINININKIITYIIIFLLIFALFSFKNTSFASSSSTYGNYQGFTSEQIDIINNIVSNPTYRENYDSFLARYWIPLDNSYVQCVISFYNYDITGDLYVESTYSDYINIAGRYFADNSAKYVVINLTTGEYISSSMSNNPSLFTKYFNGKFAIYTNRNIYNNNSFNSIYFSSSGDISATNPYITNSLSDIENWSFDTFNITGSVPMYFNFEGSLLQKHMKLYLKFNDYWYSMDISKYFTGNVTTNFSTWNISIPKNELFNDYFIPTSDNYDGYIHLLNRNFVLGVGGISYNGENINSSFDTAVNYDLGTYDITLSVNVANDINGQNNSNQQQQIINEQKDTNNNLNNINNSINDSNVDDSNVEDFANLGNSFNANDISGIDELFQVLYDAFCTNNIQELVFTVPFTNKQVTINTTNISSFFPQQVKSIVGVFVWGVIGLWVLKDIRTIIDKISEGNPENVGSDIKKEVL